MFKLRLSLTREKGIGLPNCANQAYKDCLKGSEGEQENVVRWESPAPNALVQILSTQDWTTSS